MKHILQTMKRRWSPHKRLNWVSKSFTHISGPKYFNLKNDEIALILLGRNVSHFLRHNIEYHKRLGVSKVVYVDNGSDDNSLEIVSNMPDTITARTTADFSKSQHLMRFLANSLYTRGGWHLSIDPDELIDFADRSPQSLSNIVSYMESRGHTGLVAQMLEMVPNTSISNLEQVSFAQDTEKFTRYDLRNITSKPYHGSDIPWHAYLDKNATSNEDIRILFGGIRRTVFGEDCCLTKHALFKPGKGVTPMPHPHVTTGLYCTDFSVVLKHYKFSGNFVARENRLIKEKRISHDEMALRVNKINERPEINLGTEAQYENPTPEKLIEQGFLQMSPEAADFFGVALPR